MIISGTTDINVEMNCGDNIYVACYHISTDQVKLRYKNPQILH